VSFDVSRLFLTLLLANWTALTALRVALLLLLKEKESRVQLSDIQMQFMEQTAHRHIFISSILRGTPNKGVDGVKMAICNSSTP